MQKVHFSIVIMQTIVIFAVALVRYIATNAAQNTDKQQNYLQI